MASSAQVLCSLKARGRQHHQVACRLHYSHWLVHLYGFPSLRVMEVSLQARSDLLSIASCQLRTRALLPRISVSAQEVAAFALEEDPWE